MSMHSLKMILMTMAVLFFFMPSCAEKEVSNSEQQGSHPLENYFFKLDFSSDSYNMSDIEDNFFTTFPHDDPTRGDVVYDRKKWTNKDIIKLVPGDGLYLYIKKRADALFDSFRLTSKAFYNLDKDTQRILFVFKGVLPSARGIWPAWWLNGSRQDPWVYKNSDNPVSDADLDAFSGKGHFYDTASAVNVTDWPASGEIDIIETINGDSIIYNTIHTCPQMCDSEWNGNGQIVNCANAVDGDPNSGCSGQPYAVSSAQGTFACLWESNRLKFYYWAAGADVRSAGGPLSAKPQPDLWPDEVLMNEVHLLETESECNKAEHQEWQCANCQGSDGCVFSNMKMIFNATLCGTWAGNRFDETARALQNCRDYINAEGQEVINNQFMKIEYVAISKI